MTLTDRNLSVIRCRKKPPQNAIYKKFKRCGHKFKKMWGKCGVDTLKQAIIGALNYVSYDKPKNKNPVISTISGVSCKTLC